MKKSLIALAALSAASAFAQSSVTLYGIVEATSDIGYSRKQDSSATARTFNPAGVLTGTTVTPTTSEQKNNLRIQDGSSQGTGSSRVGFRGTEDLGAGLKANFVLEMGLRIDDGCTTLAGVVGAFGTAPNASNSVRCNNGGNSEDSGGATFGRNAWGGVSGEFGEVRLGRQVTGSFGVQGNSFAAGTSNGLYDSAVLVSPAISGVRFSNAIRYLSPSFAGLKGSVMVAAPETAANTASTGATTNSASRRAGVDLALEYANGPVYIGFGTNKRDTGNVTSVATPVLGGASTVFVSPGVITAYTLGGSYDLGVVKPFLNYTRETTAINGSTIAPATFATASNNSNVVHKAFSIGLRAPFGPVTAIAGYGRGTIDTNGATVGTTGLGVVTNGSTVAQEKRDAFQLGAQYALSKRTLVEANYGNYKVRTNTAGTSSSALVGSTVTTTRANERINALNVGLKHSF